MIGEQNGRQCGDDQDVKNDKTRNAVKDKKIKISKQNINTNINKCEQIEQNGDKEHS